MNKNSGKSNFVYSTNPWFDRGGNYKNGVESGVFAFSHDHGSVQSWIGFRVVFCTIFQKGFKISKTRKNRIHFHSDKLKKMN